MHGHWLQRRLRRRPPRRLGLLRGRQRRGALAGLDLGHSFTNVPAAPPLGLHRPQRQLHTTTARSRSRSQRPTPTARSTATAAPMTATPTGPRAPARASTARAPWPALTSAKASPTSPAGPPTGPSPTKAATTKRRRLGRDRDLKGDPLDRRRRQVQGLRRLRSALHLQAERLRRRRGRPKRRRHRRGGLQP